MTYMKDIDAGELSGLEQMRVFQSGGLDYRGIGHKLGFEIAVVDLATGQVRQLTTGRGSCEYPSWAPNGRHLVFACNRGGTWQLAQTDRMGAKLRSIAVGPGNSQAPDWSQTLK